VADWNDDDNELDEEELAAAEEEREDLTAALRQARRKPRHFAIIARGAEMLALLAQKKPFRPAVLRQARREKGGKQVIQGICQGDGGAELVFKVEGELPKIKKSRLREFISEATGLMVKPRFETGLASR
jgi:hypothetical protein